MHAQGQSLRCAWTCQSKSAQSLVILVSVARDKSRPQIKLYHFTKLIFILCLLKIISTDYLFVVVILTDITTTGGGNNVTVPIATIA